MKIRHVVLLLCLYSGLAFSQTIVLVRHAEKSAPTGDVPLSDLGRARAKALAHALQDLNVRSIFVTEFRRTRETAGPAAEKFHVEPKAIPANDLDAIVGQLKAAPTNGVYLVVGHSNTVPAIIEKLGAGTVPPIDDAEYDHLYVVTTDAGKARVLSLRY